MTFKGLKTKDICEKMLDFRGKLSMIAIIDYDCNDNLKNPEN